MSLSGDVQPSRSTLAVAGAIVVACLTMFALIAHDLREGGSLVSHDEAVLRWFVEHRTAWLVSAAKLIGALCSFVPLSIVAALIGLWLWRRGSRVGLALAPLISLVLASLASTTAKGLFDRNRPPADVQATAARLASFPSGHATDSAAFFLALAFTLALVVARRRSAQLMILAAGVVIPAVVGVSRLVLGVHWLSDVVAGWALGTAFAITVVVALWYFSTTPNSGS